jgi:hypothetical protein
MYQKERRSLSREGREMVAIDPWLQRENQHRPGFLCLSRHPRSSWYSSQPLQHPFSKTPPHLVVEPRLQPLLADARDPSSPPPPPPPQISQQHPQWNRLIVVRPHSTLAARSLAYPPDCHRPNRTQAILYSYGSLPNNTKAAAIVRPTPAQ